jgi:hypothetical protein
MAKPRPWTVLPHEPIRPLVDGVWMVRGDIPGMNMPLRRTMTVARRGDGTLLLHSVIALDDATMTELESFGRPSVMVIPNGWHQLDAAAYKERYPDLEVVCPRRDMKKVGQQLPVDRALEDFPADTGLRAEILDGFDREGVIVAGSAASAVLVFGDTVMNVPHMKGGEAFFYRLMGISGGPRVHTLMKLLSKKRRLREHLFRLADTPDLASIVPGHGDPIVGDAANVLREVADRM